MVTLGRPDDDTALQESTAFLIGERLCHVLSWHHALGNLRELPARPGRHAVARVAMGDGIPETCPHDVEHGPRGGRAVELRYLGLEPAPKFIRAQLLEKGFVCSLVPLMIASSGGLATSPGTWALSSIYVPTTSVSIHLANMAKTDSVG
jgi:hypothetical protein